jgi:hypothetical protein
MDGVGRYFDSQTGQFLSVAPEVSIRGPPSIEPAGADRVELGRSVAIGLGEEVFVVDVGNATLE